ncbi:hypothetical protein MBLNU459_g2476t1 [Dothideomycetes sp. NU459]
MPSEGEFPYLRSSSRLGAKGTNIGTAVFDVKFYPYADPESDPVFAAVVGRDIFVCRPGPAAETPVEVLKVFRDPDEKVLLNSVVWSQDLASGDPLLCVAGSGSRKIRILNVRTGQLDRVVSGHGGDINDLAISPLSPQILASCSADYSIRIWNLDPRHEKQPCAAILSGEGHRHPILALAFHASGKYLLSGGQDSMICLWAVPDVPDKNAGSDNTSIIYYPHFASIDIHSDYVDCVQFWGDLIFSRACGGSGNNNADDFKRNDILLWRIEGFSSLDPVPPNPPLPLHGVHTRSAFGGQFQRLLTFELKNAFPCYMRFGLFDQVGRHPMLVMGNVNSRFSFWDLQRVEEGFDMREDSTATRGKKRGRLNARGGNSFSGLNLGREHSSVSNASSAQGTSASTPSVAPAEHSSILSDPYRAIKAHKMITVPKMSFACRQVAWSNCGKWCVAVGENAMVVIFKRWD